jgi:hypothetical protein
MAERAGDRVVIEYLWCWRPQKQKRRFPFAQILR